MADTINDPQSQQNTTPFDTGRNPLLNLLMGTSPFMGLGEQAQPAVPANVQEGLQAQGSPELSAILNFLSPGATRRTIGGQLEGQPAPDPFTNLNAMRESAQSNELDKMRHELAMQQAGQQLAAFMLHPDPARSFQNPNVAAKK